MKIAEEPPETQVEDTYVAHLVEKIGVSCTGIRYWGKGKSGLKPEWLLSHHHSCETLTKIYEHIVREPELLDTFSYDSDLVN